MAQPYMHQLSALKEQVKINTLDKDILRMETSLKSPFVYLDGREGIIIIYGTSIMDNTVSFYDTILKFIDHHFMDIKSIRAYFRIVYSSSASGRYYMLLVRKLDKMFFQGRNIEIFWFQEADCFDTYADGHDIKSVIRAPLHVLELNDEELVEVDQFLSNL